MTRPAGKPIGPNPDIALGPGRLEAVENSVYVMDIRKTDRAKQMLSRASYYAGEHHDHLNRTWDCAFRDPGVGYLQERLKPQGFVPTQSIPYGMRKPDTGLPLARQITNRFSEMLLGAGRQPSMYAPADVRTERYLHAVFAESLCWDVLIEARDVAGSCGSAAIVPAVINGRPTAEVLKPYDLHVLAWKPGPTWEPAAVIEQRLVERVVPNEETNKLETKRVWRTRLWTDTHAISYDDAAEDHDPEEPLTFRPENKIEHKAGRCPVIWYQNTRCTASPDGEADCAGVWHLVDQIDRLMSQIYKASRANVDPLLHHKEAERLRRRVESITKGGLVSTSEAGDVKYVEMQGNGVTVALEVARMLRTEALQTAECVIVDPSTAGAYKTGEALQLLWRAMEAKANRLRVMLAQAMREMTRIWVTLGLALGVDSIEDAPTQRTGGILLPPLVTPIEQSEEELLAGERPSVEVSTHDPGKGAHVEFRWPPYWQPTTKQINEMAAGMNVAGQASILSDESRVGQMASLLGLDPQEEMARVARDSASAQKKAEADFEREMERVRAEQPDEPEQNTEDEDLDDTSGEPVEGDDEA